MNSRTPLLGTLVRKDLRLFWQFAALLSALIVSAEFPALVLQMGPLGELLRVVVSLGTILLILVVFHEDAVVSLKHDWLTRPIPGSTQLLAKLVFVVLVVIAPAILGGIANSLYMGRSAGESLVTGLSSGTGAGTLTLVAIVMCVAAITGGMRQAIIAVLAAFAFFAVLALLMARLGTGESNQFSGSSWIVGRTLQWLLLAATISVLIIQYRHRHTRAARVIVGSAVLLGCAILALMSWPRVFAVQKALSPEPAAAINVRAQLVQACFPARVLDAAGGGNPSGRAAEIRPDVFSDEQRSRAGSNAVAFSTRMAPHDVPEGSIIRVGRVIARWRAGGKVLHGALPGESRQRWVLDDAGQAAVDHYWLLKREDYERLAAQVGVEIQVDYSMTLLAAQATSEFLADGQRAWRPGIGYCSATFDRARGVVSVNCYKWGAQPALLAANIAGRPDIERKISRWPDYTPAILDFWGGTHHDMSLTSQGPETPRVIVTAYRARTHFDRQIVVPGVLGGSVSACPAP